MFKIVYIERNLFDIFRTFEYINNNINNNIIKALKRNIRKKYANRNEDSLTERSS